MVNPSHAAYLALLALVAAERVRELRLSDRHARSMLGRGGVEVGRRHYRVMVALHAAFLVACAVEVIGLDRPFPGAPGGGALAVAVAAQLLRVWAMRTLGDHWTARIVVIPEAWPIANGPYRYVRHPNYLAVTLEIAAIPLIHGAYVTAIVFSLANALLLSVRVRAEEAALGSGYARAFARRPRFIPGGRR